MLKSIWRKMTVVISMFMVLVLTLSACGNPVETAPAGNTGSTGTTTTPAAPAGGGNAGGKDVFTTSVNTGAIETLVGNPYISPGIQFSNFVYDTLFEYSPFPKDTFIPMLGESFKEEGNKLTVTLRKGAKWSDGKPFSSKDVLNSYYLAFITNNVIWNYLANIEAPDENTVVFTWRKQGPVLKQIAFEVQIMAPHHLYGKWGDQAPALIAKLDANGKLDKESDAQRVKIREDLFTFKPKLNEMVGTSPYVVDNVTSSEILLKKRADAWNSDKAKFNKIVVMRYTTLDAYVPNAISGKYDGEQHGMPPDIFAQVEKAPQDLKMFWITTGQQAQMIFNTSKYPVNDVNVRKALIYAINLKAVQPVFEVGTLDPDNFITGLVPSFRNMWVSKEATSKMTDYTYNAAKAEELLKKAGWSKGSDGFWKDAKGQLVQIEISSMNNWPIFFLGGDAIANQLNQFGIKAVFKPMEYSAYLDYMKSGQHTIAMQFASGITYGHPWGAYKNAYKDNAVWLGLKDPKDQSSGFPKLEVKIPATGETVDVYSLIDELFYTVDKAEQAKIVEKLSYATNELVPFFPIGEKATPFKLFHTKDKITGYPEDAKDPAWFGGSSQLVFSKLIKTGNLDWKK